jgi:hypothetical protein
MKSCVRVKSRVSRFCEFSPIGQGYQGCGFGVLKFRWAWAKMNLHMSHSIPFKSPLHTAINKQMPVLVLFNSDYLDEFVKNRPKCSPISFCQIVYIAFTGEKSSPIIGATSVKCRKTTRSKQSPIGRKFAQSGHPEYCTMMVRGLD